MTDREILKKAIEKAVKGGWNDFDGKGSYLDKDISNIIIGMWHIEKIIFSHEFAKAFWGIKRTCKYCGNVKFDNYGFCYCKSTTKTIGNYHSHIDSWQYHLQQMILEKEPLKYLERFL